MTNDRSVTFRMNAAAYADFASMNEDVSGRLRYLIQRDLKERRRKRHGGKDAASGQPNALPEVKGS